MDADFSHPPDELPRLYRALDELGVDAVVGSRYVPGGRVENWPFSRLMMSRLACVLARPLTPVRDATSGFFLARRHAVEGVTIGAGGFKICLELLMRGRIASVAEAPYVFTDRAVGESKMSTREALGYLVQLRTLFALQLRGPRRDDHVSRRRCRCSARDRHAARSRSEAASMSRRPTFRWVLPAWGPFAALLLALVFGVAELPDHVAMGGDARLAQRLEEAVVRRRARRSRRCSSSRRDGSLAGRSRSAGRSRGPCSSSGCGILATAFLSRLPPSAWLEIPFKDDWTELFQQASNGVALLRRGVVVGWNWWFLGGYPTSTDIAQNFAAVAFIPMTLLGDRLGYHVLHAVLFLAVPALHLVGPVAHEIARRALGTGLAGIFAAGYLGPLGSSGDTNSLVGVCCAGLALIGSRAARLG